MRYFKFPKWLKGFYPNAVWDFFLPNSNKKIIYLTFDDGPNPKTTSWILKTLQKYNAKATFFCIGKKAKKHPDLLQNIKQNGHLVGNHTFNHINGFFTPTKIYLDDVQEARKWIDSTLFRPPFGKMKPKQYKALKNRGYTVVFWSHITYDFDASFPSEKRMAIALKRVKNGSIVVFHDANKSFPNLKLELPLLLEKWSNLGFKFNTIPT